MTDKESMIKNDCPSINRPTKEMIDDYIRNIAQQEIIKDKINELEFKMNFDKMQDKMKKEIWRTLNG